MGETNTLKAIETVYKGYRFRSRLEARWAVFFDVIGIEYEYEPEGFDLGDLGWYLPDFFLPQVEMWAEVKPKALTFDELSKCRALTWGTREPCLMLIGPPAKKEYEGFMIDKGVDWNGRITERTVIVSYTVAKTKWLESEGRFPVFYCFDNYMFDILENYSEAVRAARQARFEHGEHGYERKSYEPSVAIGVTAR